MIYLLDEIVSIAEVVSSLSTEVKYMISCTLTDETLELYMNKNLIIASL